MTLQAMLFDLDGTLLDTAPEFAACLNILLQQRGQAPILVEELRPFVSFGAKGMIEFCFKIEESDPNFAALKADFLNNYLNLLGSKTCYFPGIPMLLGKLQEKSIPWAIVTNKPALYTFPLLQKFPLLDKAHCVVAGDSLPTKKPDPAPLLHACEQLQVAPAHCWYIGDAHSDVQASQQAGMRCAVAGYGYLPTTEDPATWGAEHYVRSADALLKLVI